MQDLAVLEQPSSKQPAKPKQRRISPAVKQALDLLFSGECKTQKAAAERVGISPEYLSRQLAQDHVNAYFRRKADREIRALLPSAVAVKAAILDKGSEKYQNEVASEIMAIGGIAAPKQPGLTINNNVAVAGYVIGLQTKAERAAQAIDLTPEVTPAQSSD